MPLISGTANSDNLTGTSENDTIRGRAGNDIMRGEAGHDLLRGNRGQDILYGGLGNDRLEGGADNDTLYGGDGNDRLYGGSGNDSLEGGNGKDILNGGSGDDKLLGGAGNDRLIGGVGDDELVGGDGSDTYIYRRGDGSDQIADYSANKSDTDRLVLKDLIPEDVHLIRPNNDHTGVANHLILEIKDPATGEPTYIYIHEQFDPDYPGTGIEEITFADGTIWDRETIAQMTNHYEGTDQNDILIGNEASETFHGGKGDDVLAGGRGSDTYFYRRGDGNDEIHEANLDPYWDREPNEDVDRLVFTDLNIADLEFHRFGAGSIGQSLFIYDPVTGTGVEIYAQFGTEYPTQAIEEIEFADGTVWDTDAIAKNVWYRGSDYGDVMQGTFQSETFLSGQGNDEMIGYWGSDTYIFRPVHGHDEIFEFGDERPEWANDTDQIVFVDLNPQDVALRRFDGEIGVSDYRSSNNLLIETLPNSSHDRSSILVWDQFTDAPGGFGIEEIVFADGTVWDRAAIEFNTNRYTGTDQNDALIGSELSEVFVGGAGDDLMEGGLGSDTFEYSLGDGSDIILADEYNNPTPNSDHDLFLFKDITSDQVRLIQDEWNLILFLQEDGASIHIESQFDETRPNAGIEEIQFSDSVTWNREMIIQNLSSWGDDFL